VVSRLRIRSATPALLAALLLTSLGTLFLAPARAAGGGTAGGSAETGTEAAAPDGERDPDRPVDPRWRAKLGRAATAPTTRFEMPFPCQQAWTGTTRASHSPSVRAIDWNRTDDDGDPVVAAAPGVVTTAYSTITGGYGKWVVVDHGSGESSLYGHLSAVSVKVGQQVDQGQVLGAVGSTGNSTGPHLHFEERLNGTVITPFFHGVQFEFGSTLTSQNCADVPMAADMIGGSVTELVVFRRTWPASFLIRRPKKAPKVVPFGATTDDPILGDWDGNGRANLGVRTPATRTFRLLAGGVEQAIVFGSTKDKPVAGDWDGDGTWEVGVRRAADASFRLRAADGTVTVIKLGDANDLAVTGDWDGDGRTDLGVFDQATSTYTLRLLDGDGLVWTAQVPFGSPGDLPVVGDWDGNGKSDLGVWDPVTAVVSQRRSSSATSSARSVVEIPFGNPR
jgi:biotin carboxyl carrier protein